MSNQSPISPIQRNFRSLQVGLKDKTVKQIEIVEMDIETMYENAEYLLTFFKQFQKDAENAEGLTWRRSPIHAQFGVHGRSQNLTLSRPAGNIRLHCFPENHVARRGLEWHDTTARAWALTSEGSSTGSATSRIGSSSSR